MNGIINNALKAFGDFVPVMRDKENVKCVLLAKKRDEILVAISGMDNQEERDPMKQMQDQNSLLGMIREALCDSGVLKNAKKGVPSYPVVIPIGGDVFYKDTRFNENGVKEERCEFLSDFGGQLPKDRRRDFSCVEKKLLAWSNNSKSEMSKLDWIICRYTPCWRCKEIAEDLPNFYCFGAGEAYNLIIESNPHLVCFKLNDSENLFLQVTAADGLVAGKYIDFDSGYVFIKNFI